MGFSHNLGFSRAATWAVVGLGAAVGAVAITAGLTRAPERVVAVPAFVPDDLDPKGRPYGPEASTGALRDCYDLLVRLSEQLGDAAMDPGLNPLEEAVRAVQASLGVPLDGQCSPNLTDRMRLYLTAQPQPNPSAAELDFSWESIYAQKIAAAVAACCEDPRVVSFDQAVLAVLGHVFPDAGGFALLPSSCEWKRRARSRVREDLTRALGPSEAEARAVLTLHDGKQALERGAELSQAVHEMCKMAFPGVRWDGPRSPWQYVFVERARQGLEAFVADSRGSE